MDMYEYFKQQWPNEGVGYIKDGEFFPLENLSKDPTNSFEVGGEFLIEGPDALVHSHTIGNGLSKSIERAREPSKADLENQIATDIEWGIVITDGDECEEVQWFGDPDRHAPLLGRRFVYNYHDCFTLVKDWYWDNRKVFIQGVPRHVGWDHRGDAEQSDHLEKNFEAAGFRKVPLSEIEPGDVLFYKIRSRVVNHLAVYLGANRILTHFYEQLSREADFGEMGDRVQFAARYYPEHDVALQRGKTK